MSLLGKAYYYPLKDVLGTWFCYADVHIDLWSNMFAHFLTLFVSLFRFICIFHEDQLIIRKISPKKLGQMLFCGQLMLSIFLSVSVLHGSPDTATLSSCLGTYETHFVKSSGNKVCSFGTWIEQSLCKCSLLIHATLSSNIPEAFLLYPCFKAIQKQTEKSEAFLGKNSFAQRKRDNGIVISISIIQWAIEIINIVSYYSYILFLHGWSNYLDKFFSIYLISFTMIIQPSFYLNGDQTFRRSLDQKGLWSALKAVIFEC